RVRLRGHGHGRRRAGGDFAVPRLRARGATARGQRSPAQAGRSGLRPSGTRRHADARPGAALVDETRERAPRVPALPLPPGAVTRRDSALSRFPSAPRSCSHARDDMIWVGTSGYNYPEWKGSFYPADLPASKMLAYYSARFPTVEINYTFYRMPTEKLVTGWAAGTPSPFRFTLKAPKRITHDRRLRGAGRSEER